MTTARDIPILITSTASSSERRITPSWTIAHLKTKLEPVTGIAPASQKLTLRLPDQQQEIPIEAEHEESVEVGSWPLVAYAEIQVQAASLSYVLLHSKPMAFKHLSLACRNADGVMMHVPAFVRSPGLCPASIFLPSPWQLGHLPYELCHSENHAARLAPSRRAGSRDLAF